MRTKKFICVLSLLGLVNYAQQQSWQWAKQSGSLFDNSNSNNEAIRDVKTDKQGNAYAVGYFYNLPIFQNAEKTSANAMNASSYLGVKETDAYLIKYNSCGSTLWRKKIGGGNGMERAWALNFDHNGAIIVFGSSSSIHFIAGDGINDTLISNNTNPLFLSKFDANGNFLGINTYPAFPVFTTSDGAARFFINSQGNYFITNGVSAYVINTSGSIINTYTYATGTPAYNVPAGISGVKLDKYDNVYLVGAYQSTIVIGQNTTLTPTSATLSANTYWPMGIIMKYSPFGNLLWHHTSTAILGGDMAIDTSSNIFVLGGNNMPSNTNVYGYNLNLSGVGFPVLLLNTSTGSLVSGITATGTSGDYCHIRYTDRDNNFYATGELSSALKFNSTTTFSAASTVSLGGGAFYTGQMYFAHFNSLGNFVDLKRLPLQGNQFDTPLGVTKDEQGNVYMWGMFSGVLDSAGTNVFPFGGLEDGFVAKYGFACSNQTATTMSPLAPSSLTAVYQGSLSNYVTWVDNSNYETAYALWFTNTGSSTFSLLAVLPANTTTYTHTGLNYNTNYCYKAKSINNVGSSAFTNIDCAATPALSMIPAVPLTLAAINNGNLINNLTWTDNSNNETNFELWYTTGTSNTYSLLATLPANTTSYAHANLTYTTTYCYKVAATNSVGTSAFSNIACANTPDSPNQDAVSIAEKETISSYTRIYPNPTLGNVIVQFPSLGGESNIEVINSLGQTLQVLNLPAQPNSILEHVPLKLPSTKGIYLIRIKTGVNQGTVERKVVVE